MKKENKFKDKIKTIFLGIVLLIAVLFAITIETYPVTGANITNTTVLAKVNVSNTEPELYKVKIDDPIDLTNGINLDAGNAVTVTCNGSFKDINGYDDILTVNATLYQSNVASDAADNNNTHYTNASCGICSVVPGTGNQNGSCLCKFAVQYYANVGNWQCNMTIADSGGVATSQNSSDDYYINEVLGIGIENLTLDYGQMSVTEISDPIRNNVTNLGNIPINVTVRGYAGDNETTGINYTMFCSLGTNISFGYQKYSLFDSTGYADMFNLTNQTTPIEDLTIPERKTDAGYGNSSNSTFWRLQIPAGSGGMCNGSIVIGGIDATLS